MKISRSACFYGLIWWTFIIVLVMMNFDVIKTCVGLLQVGDSEPFPQGLYMIIGSHDFCCML